jgi:hypothetical protein
MENETYQPALYCEQCKRLTRHHFVRTDRRSYQCVEDRQGVSKSERKRLEKQGQFDALIYRCGLCGAERGWGNRVLGEGGLWEI